METEKWYKVGHVDHWSKTLGRYVQVSGYSLRADGGSQPWKTLAQANFESKTRGKQAVFVEKP